MLEDLQNLYDELLANNSKLAKLEVLKKYPQCKEILKYIYNPMIIFGVTSDNLKKNKNLQCITPTYSYLTDLLDDLAVRNLTGHEALATVNLFIDMNKDYEDLIYLIIDRSLKASIGVKEINKVWKNWIPEFKVALADKFIADKHNPVGMYAARKLDGLRLLTVFDDRGIPTFYSRTGKEFTTLDKLKNAFNLIPSKYLENKVLDGELCLVDSAGNEDFAGIIKLARKKDYTIENPHYKIFDYIDLKDFEVGIGNTEFSARVSLMELRKDIFTSKYMSIVKQTRVASLEEFELMIKEASDKGWEGLILRKAESGYKGKRTKDLLKCKKFHDAEFTVLNTNPTVKKMLNKQGLMEEVECLGNVEIEYRGNIVSVGSGWSDSQRVQYFNNPEDIIGKTITVNYFEETKDSKTGLFSLRFPTLKHVYEDGRED